MSKEAIVGGLRIVFFGLPAGISAAVLAGLLDGGARVTGVVIPAASVPHLLPDTSSPVAYLEPHLPAGLSLLNGATADTLAVAWSAGLPVLAARNLSHAGTLAALAALNSDVACVACFTQRIPAAALSLPRFGFLNLHPSLLPDYRGPTPLFWQLRHGAPTGVTVHDLDEGLDTGDIAAQEAVALLDGIDGPAAERQLMLAGLDLLRGVLDDMARGIVRQRPQPPGGSYFGFPDEADFTLSTDWPARRAFNFMRGAADRGLPYPIEVAGRLERLAVADDYKAGLELDRPSVRHGRHILIRFNPGILYARTVR